MRPGKRSGKLLSWASESVVLWTLKPRHLPGNNALIDVTCQRSNAKRMLEDMVCPKRLR